MEGPFLVMVLFIMGALPVALLGVWLFLRNGIHMLPLAGVIAAAVVSGVFALSWFDGRFDPGFFLFALPTAFVCTAMWLGFIALTRRLRRVRR